MKPVKLLMNKLLGLIFLSLFYSNFCFALEKFDKNTENVSAKTISDRLSEIEARLDNIEKLLEPFKEMQGLIDSLTQNKKNKKTDISSKDTTLKMNDCLKVTDQKLSITESNDIFVSYAWIIDYKNSCNKDFTAYPVLEFMDESGFLLHEISNPDRIIIPSNGTAKAKGSEMISPVSKANRITHTSAGLSSSQW